MRISAADIGVIISDSVGRAWRLGTVGLAIGAAGVPSLLDRRGEKDMSGRPLEVTEVGFADAVASAAVLVMGEAAEARPPRWCAASTGVPRPGRPPRWCGPRRRTCSDERRRPGQLRRALRRHRRRQAVAGAGAAAGRAADRHRQHRRRLRAPGPLRLARRRHRRSTRWPALSIRRPAGAGATRPGASCRRLAGSAVRPGSTSATATSPPTWSARAACGPARRSPPSRRIWPGSSALPRASCP